MTERSVVQIPVDGGEMPAHLWRPDGGSGPGVLLVQEIFGVSDYIERRAADLAAQGYVVLAPEVFWRVGVTRIENGPDMLDEAMAVMGRLDWPAAVADTVAALDALRRRPEVTGPVGMLGFCFGGGLAFNVAAERLPDALVSFYGSALPTLLELAPRVTCPQQHHFGLSDSYIPAEEVARIEAAVAGPQSEFHTYAGADHAFDNDDFTMHHLEASALAWGRTLDFLRARLQTT